MNGATSTVVEVASMVGLGGVMLATLASTSDPTAAVVPLNPLMAGVALLGALVIRPALAGS